MDDNGSRVLVALVTTGDCEDVDELMEILGALKDSEDLVVGVQLDYFLAIDQGPPLDNDDLTSSQRIAYDNI